MKTKYIVLTVLVIITIVAITASFYVWLHKQGRSSSPIPINTIAEKKLQVGVYYYTYDSKESTFWQNYLRKKLNIIQQPQLGEYNSRNPEIIKQHLAWAQDAGINFFAINWFGPGSTSDVTIKTIFLLI
ncbi:MAG: hypothetical protein V1709_03270 [Planctomycetota bacterium]